MTGGKDAATEGQDASHGIIAQIIECVASGIAEHLCQEAHDYCRCHYPRRAAIHHKTINEIKLYHQTEKPIRSWPYPLVRFGKEVDDHEPLLDNLVAIEMKTVGSDDVDDDEEHKSGYHHLEELEIMNAHES